MIDIKKILLPVDGSEHSQRATDFALSLAHRMGSEILLIYCHRRFPTMLGEPYLQNAVSSILQNAGELLAPFAAQLAAAKVPFEDRVLEGPAGQKIPDVARIEKCDLVVMGSRGRTNLEGLILGSVTHRVLHAAQCPVLVIR